MKLFFVVVISLIILTLSNCSNRNHNSYKYFEGFKLYLNSTFKIDIAENKGEKIYYVLLLEGCEPCMKYNSKMLLELQNDIVVPILIGKPSNGKWNDFINSLKMKWTVLEDSNYEIFSYETGISKPLLIHVKNGKCIFFMSVSDDKVSDASKYISGI